MAQRQRQSKQGGELSDATTKDHHLTPQFCLTASEIGKPHHLSGLPPHPATRGGLRYAAGGSEPKVPGVLDEVPEAMVVALLRAARWHHPSWPLREGGRAGARVVAASLVARNAQQRDAALAAVFP